jgi:hypothetical protein
MTLSEFERRAPPQPWSRHTQVIGEPLPKRTPYTAPPAVPGNPFIRLITAKAIAQLERTHTVDVVQRLWPDDMVLRAVSAPAMTTVTGWAKELVRQITAQALDALGPASAGAQVLRDSLVLAWDGAGAISAPGIVAGAGNASFVAEGAPIPVRQLASTAAIMSPYKLATIAVLTREMMEGGNAEQIIGDALVRACGLALDAALFGSGAATAAQPAGLRNGIAALTASSSTDMWEASVEDISALINAISAVGGAGPYSLIMNPGRAAVFIGRVYHEADAPYDVYASTAVGNDVIAVANAALVAALSPEPDVEAATAGSLVLDTAPPADPGSTGPHRSLFQTESVAIKVRWPVTWSLRNAAGVAWLTPTWK